MEKHQVQFEATLNLDEATLNLDEATLNLVEETPNLDEETPNLDEETMRILDEIFIKDYRRRKEEKRVKRAKRKKILKRVAIGAGIVAAVVLTGGALSALRKRAEKSESDDRSTYYEGPVCHNNLTFTPNEQFDPDDPDIIDTEEWEGLNDYLLDNTDLNDDEVFDICFDTFTKYLGDFNEQFNLIEQ